MKEIGKLIELLNEYEKKRIDKINSEGKHLPIKLQFRPYTEEVLINKGYKGVILEVISKSYGFIKWLVENDKIDFEKPIGEFANKYKLIVPDDFYLKELSKEDELLMLLSIQDEPINFLISILK